jgi:hypothetical protein
MRRLSKPICAFSLVDIPNIVASNIGRHHRLHGDEKQAQQLGRSPTNELQPKQLIKSVKLRLFMSGNCTYVAPRSA